MEIGVYQGEKRVKHSSSLHKILLVGEGDFSFAKCLAKAFGSAVNMTATSLDSEESLMQKYTDAMANVKELKDLGCAVLHEVDAGNMKQNPQLDSKLFDRIVFNFPHAGFSFFCNERHATVIERHQDVVRGFLRNARDMVTANGEIHVTHKTTHPFSKWEIENLAEEVGLFLVEKEKFCIWEYEGYQNKRGDGNRSNMTFPVGECATFKFAERRYTILIN